MTVSHAVHVSMSAQQEQSLRARSIQSILMSAQSAAHVLMFAHLRQSAFRHNGCFLMEETKGGWFLNHSPFFKNLKFKLSPAVEVE